ncbi:MAG: fatty acid desaturase family protein [Patescibacteria group bacterium]
MEEVTRQHTQLSVGTRSRFAVIEATAIVVSVACQLILLYRLVTHHDSSAWIVLFCFALGLLTADAITGLIHWGADTWGSEDVPFVGKMLIRPFREHHVDPTSITRHDFLETNGNNFLVSLVVAAPAAFLSSSASVAAFCLSLSVAVSFTNQIHKWAHMEKPPFIACTLQRVRLVLTREGHAIHHTFPHMESYNITNGWLNEAFNRIGFYRRLEWVITKTSRAVPRREDLKNLEA